ncbi:MAG: carboxypeptidase-like regulatory domain-containing protein [Candidatus Eisenbacteria bacterium]
MRARRLFPVFFALALLFSACSDKSDNPIDPVDETGVLRGRVVDSSGEAGLAGATVRIAGTDLVAVTAEDGSFEFTGLGDGDFTVIVEPPAGGSHRSNRVGISVHSGQTVTVDVTCLPDSATVGEIAIYPASARSGVLESVHFYIAPRWWDASGGEDFAATPHRPTWSIHSQKPIGVISREGIFIGTAVGRGQVIASFSEELSAAADIEVVADGDVARIIVHPPYRLRVPEGESRYLAAYAINGAGEIASGVPFVWGVEPAALGTIELVEDLTPEETEAILRGLLWGNEWYGGATRPYEIDGGPAVGGDSTITDPPPPDDGGDEPLPPGPLPLGLDLSSLSIVRFTASAAAGAEARGWITVRVEGADWRETVEVAVVARGTLTAVRLYPDEITLSPGEAFAFFAYGENEWGEPLADLEYDWSIDPISLGSVEEIDPPWMGPGGDPDDPDDSGGFGGCEPADSAWPPGPMPPDGRPVPGWGGGALFTPAELGEGTITVLVHDPVAGVTIEERAAVHVAPAPVLDHIEMRPNPIEARLGDSLFVGAAAYDTRGDIAWGAEIRWELTGNAGVFVPYDGPHVAEEDSIFPHGEPRGPNGGPGDPTDPNPGDGRSFGTAFGFFLANNPNGTGELRAIAATSDGLEVEAAAPITVVNGR